MAEYMNWAKPRQAQNPLTNSTTGYESLLNWSPNQMPEMVTSPTAPMDWTQNASSQLGTGGFMGADLTPQMGLLDKMGTSDFWLGSKNNTTGMQTMGAAAPAIQGASALFNGFMGMKQYGLSKDIFENNKQQFERNFGAQKGITNSQLSDRQDRRNADARANGQTTTSTADYMSKWGVK